MRLCSVRIAYWIPKAINTILAHVILIALLLQQRLQNCTSVLRDTYVDCPVLKIKQKGKWVKNTSL